MGVLGLLFCQIPEAMLSNSAISKAGCLGGTKIEQSCMFVFWFRFPVIILYTARIFYIIMQSNLMRNFCFLQGSRDNMSVILVAFSNAPTPCPTAIEKVNFEIFEFLS